MTIKTFPLDAPVRRIALVLFWALVVLAVTMALLPKPPHVVSWNDKTQHMTAFAVLSFVAAFAFPRAPLTRVAERLSFLGALIEVAQSIPALHRDCDIYDWIADTIAILLALAVVGVIRRIQHFSRS